MDNSDFMDNLKVFERVNLKMPLEQRIFFDYLNDTADELEALYPGYVLVENPEGEPDTLTAQCPVRPLYCGAAADNILYLAGAGDGFKAEFLRKAEAAFLRYWHINAKGRAVKPWEGKSNV